MHLITIWEAHHEALTFTGTELERHYEHSIQQALAGIIQAAMHPRTAVSVILQVVEHDGSLLACALNAASTALTDAAVPMTSIMGMPLM